MRAFVKGDLVACYLTNTEVFEELLMWGIVLDVEENLNDVLVLDNLGNKSWYPSKRWRALGPARDHSISISGLLA